MAALSVILLILSFPNFEFSFLVWFALIPLLYAIVFRPVSPVGAFVLGWLVGAGYLLGTCYWLTYAMIHYGGIPTPIAYLLLLPPALIVGLFPGGFAWLLRRLAVRWGVWALWIAPLLWIAAEFLRFRVTGQLWNALGYSQAFHPAVIDAAQFGGVYAVSGSIVLTNVVLAFWVGKRSFSLPGVALTLVAAVVVAWPMLLFESPETAWRLSNYQPVAEVVAIQPNVPMDPVTSLAEADELMRRHVSLSENAWSSRSSSTLPRLTIWPESPMSFAYSRDTALREQLAAFAARNRTSLMINSLEPAPNDGAFNSAMLIDPNGRLTAQYDKIYLLPFGEYLPIPSWIPGTSLIPPVVGTFTAGERYPLLPVGPAKAGVMICFESAIPSLARHYSASGADVLIEMTNDGYLGPTPVLRQHLANAVFRAVENRRPVIRATNTGITAVITEEGVVQQPTAGFTADARLTAVALANRQPTFYARFGDLLAWVCVIGSFALALFTFFAGRPAPTRIED
jgi:apolipoprotein N-acyltransferase